jgi:transcriptional regulator with XRE-family HTH domain
MKYDYIVLKKLRLKFGHKQEYVANFLKISQSNYSKIENGLLNPSISLLEKLSDFYEQDVTNNTTKSVQDYNLDSMKKEINDINFKLEGLQNLCKKLEHVLGNNLS